MPIVRRLTGAGRFVPRRVRRDTRLLHKATGDDWMLRGIDASVHVSKSAEAAIVLRSVVSELVSTSLLALIDACSSAVDFELDAEIVDSQEVAVNINSHPSTRQSVLPPMPVGGKLDWHDVLLLAEPHGVKCVCDSAHTSITLRVAQHAGAIASQLH